LLLSTYGRTSFIISKEPGIGGGVVVSGGVVSVVVGGADVSGCVVGSVVSVVVMSYVAYAFASLNVNGEPVTA